MNSKTIMDSIDKIDRATTGREVRTAVISVASLCELWLQHLEDKVESQSHEITRHERLIEELQRLTVVQAIAIAVLTIALIVR